MTKFLLAVLSLLLVAACSAQPGANGAASIPKASREKALPVIAVSGSEIKINGTTVWLGDTLVAWTRVLGGVPDCYDAGGIITCVWHSNGLSLGTDHIDKTRVTFMLLDLTIEPPALGERAASWPKSPFLGTLELDGIPIYANTVFRDLRHQVAPVRELRCGGSDCWEPSAAFSDGANIHMSLAGRSDSSRILHFSISCTSTESCMALMPIQKKR
jgi:hypothetical protein